MMMIASSEVQALKFNLGATKVTLQGCELPSEHLSLFNLGLDSV